MMGSWTRITSPQVGEFPAFAHAAIAGDQVYVSGMLGLDDDFSAMVEGGIGPETTQSLRNVERILRACELSLADVVKVTAYLVDLEEWDAMNEAYIAAFGERTPARIAVGCASLLFGARVEFDCIAYRG
jgi:2-iminobutanoate/2-iminopropanoate deaminase